MRRGSCCVSGDGGPRAVGAGDWRGGAKIARAGSRASTRDRRIDRPRSHASVASSPTARVFERTPIARVRVLTVGKSIGSAVARTSAAFEGCIRSNSTTRPPLSPVARCSPVLSNSTALIMSAVGDRGRTGVGRSASVIAAAWKSDIHRGCRVGWVGARVSLSLACYSPSCTSSPGVRSPNTWLKFQSSCPRGSLAAAISPAPQPYPTLSPTLCAGSSAKIAEGLLFPGASRRRNGTRRDL